MKTILKVKSESGRTMAEMLATLAIVGILSITALVGFRYAMELHRENESVDWIVKTVVGSRTGFLLEKYGDEAGMLNPKAVPMQEVISGVAFDFVSADDKSSRTYTTPLETKVSVDVISKNAFEVHLENATFSMCRKLLKGPLEYQVAFSDQSGLGDIYPDSSADEVDEFCGGIDTARRSPSKPQPEIVTDVVITLCFSSDENGCFDPLACGQCQVARNGLCLACADVGLKCCDGVCRSKCPSTVGPGGNDEESGAAGGLDRGYCSSSTDCPEGYRCGSSGTCEPEEETTDPKTTDPKTTDPEVVDPETTDPETTDPEAVDPKTTDPNVTTTETTDPKTTDPEVVDPETTDSNVTTTETTDPNVTTMETTDPNVTTVPEETIIGGFNPDGRKCDRTAGDECETNDDCPGSHAHCHSCKCTNLDDTDGDWGAWGCGDVDRPFGFWDSVSGSRVCCPYNRACTTGKGVTCCPSGKYLNLDVDGFYCRAGGGCAYCPTSIEDLNSGKVVSPTNQDFSLCCSRLDGKPTTIITGKMCCDMTLAKTNAYCCRAFDYVWTEGTCCFKQEQTNPACCEALGSGQWDKSKGICACKKGEMPLVAPDESQRLCCLKVSHEGIPVLIRKPKISKQ